MPELLLQPLRLPSQQLLLLLLLLRLLLQPELLKPPDKQLHLGTVLQLLELLLPLLQRPPKLLLQLIELLCQLDQPRRELVRLPDEPPSSTKQLPINAATRVRREGIHQQNQRTPDALHLVQVRRRDPRLSPTVL